MNIDLPYYLRLFQIQHIILEYSILNEILTLKKTKEILTQI